MSAGDDALHKREPSKNEPAQLLLESDTTTKAKTDTEAYRHPVARVHGSQNAREITSDFTSAASRLETGQLVKDEFFTLFEAVGALEIMDPKMDNGYLAPNEALEDDFDTTRPLTPSQVVGVMDAIMCSEAAWHKGHPLSQTVFTSLYIDRLLWPEPETIQEASFSRGSPSSKDDRLVHVVLRAYCLALVKACDEVYQVIMSQTFYEEEDFVSNLYNRSLLSRFSTSDVCELLEAAIQTTETMADLKTNYRTAIVKRLKLRLAFLKVVAAAPDGTDHAERRDWAECLALLEELVESQSLGELMPESFSAKVQRKLASTVPPRPIVQISFEATAAFFKNMFGSAVEVYSVLDCPRTSNIITFLQVFLSIKPQPSVYVRGLLQALIFSRIQQGQNDKLREFCFDDLSELVLPAHTLTDPANENAEHPDNDRFKIFQRMNNFVEQACDPFLDIVRALCMNRARSRRMLCNLLVEWDNVQLDLEELDNELQQYTHEKPLWDDTFELPLSSWAYYYKLLQMQWIVQLGFELNIYHVDEWPGIYRYLQELAEYRHKHIGRIFGFLDHRLAAAKPTEHSKIKAIEHSMAFLATAGEEVAATASLAECLACLYKAISLLSLLPCPPPRPYGKDDLRRALRLRPFMPLCLPALESPDTPFASVEKLASSLQMPTGLDQLPAAQRKALALLDRADQLGRQSRKAWDNVSKVTAESAACIGCEEKWRRGIREIMRAAVVAGITGVKVRKWVLDGGKEGQIRIKIDNGVLDEQARAGLSAPWIVPEVLGM